MGAEQLISESALIEFWRVGRQSVYRWRTGGRIVPSCTEAAANGAHYFYTLDAIDAYHTEHSSGFTDDMPMLTVAELLESDQSLLLPSEAAGIFGCADDVLLRRVRAGKVPAFYLGKQRSVRLPAAYVTMLASSVDGYVLPDIAARILCIQPSSVYTLMKNGHLKGGYPPGSKIKHVERKSLLALIGRLINKAFSPEVWWQRTIQAQDPPLAKDQLVAQHHVHHRTLDRLVTEHSRLLPFIRTLSNKPRTLIPAWGVQTFLQEERERMPVAQLAALFGVTEVQAETWHHPHTLCNRNHGQAWHTCPSRQCVREYIAAHRTTESIDPDEWMAAALQRDVRPVFSDDLIVTTVALEQSDIEEAIATGTLSGVRLPDWQGRTGLIALDRIQATAFKRWWERRFRHEYE